MTLPVRRKSSLDPILRCWWAKFLNEILRRRRNIEYTSGVDAQLDGVEQVSPRRGFNCQEHLELVFFDLIELECPSERLNDFTSLPIEKLDYRSW